METKIIEYLKKLYNNDTIIIGHVDIDGATCTVSFYTDESRYYVETTTINVWEMMFYLIDDVNKCQCAEVYKH